jgi:hypothetical protein
LNRKSEFRSEVHDLVFTRLTVYHDPDSQKWAWDFLPDYDAPESPLEAGKFGFRSSASATNRAIWWVRLYWPEFYRASEAEAREARRYRAKAQ